MDEKFREPLYEDWWAREYEFAQYGGERSIYWIKLRYFIMRDNFTSRLGRALDFGTKAENGKNIFRGVDAAALEALEALDYKLINEEPSPANADEDVYEVVELYGYCPERTFTQYGSEVVRRFGVEDTAGYLKYPMAGRKAGSANLQGDIENYDSANDEFRINCPAGNFNPGDSIKFWGEWVYASGTTTGQYFTTPEVEIKRVYSDYFTIPAFETPKRDGSGVLDKVATITILYNKRTYYDTASLNELYIVRELSVREASTIETNVRSQITYHLEPPALETRFNITTAQGVEMDKVTVSTIPNLADWKAKIAAGKEIIASDATITPIHTLYKKTVKYIKAR